MIKKSPGLVEIMPYDSISSDKNELLDYSFWHLPDLSKGKLHSGVKRVDLKELYATIYLNLHKIGIINTKNEPDICVNILLIEEWKRGKLNFTEEEKKARVARINSLYPRLNNKYLIHQVLNNLFTPLLFNKSVIYIDTDIIYLTEADDLIINHLNKIYGDCHSELIVTDVDFLLIKRHKLICERTGGVMKTNLDRLSIHRSSRMEGLNLEIKTEFTNLVRDFNLNKVLQ